MSPTLHTVSQVLSARHLGSWYLLASAAGSVNAAAFLSCQRFVTHVTGTLTIIGLDTRWWALMLEYGLVLFAFIGGAMASVVDIQARSYRGLAPRHARPLLMVAAVLVCTAAAGQAGLFGAFGGQVEQASNFELLCSLAFAMGLLNGSVATSTANLVRTTHMTGPATDLGINLSTAWYTVGEERRQALRLAALRGGKITAFAVGAGLMVPVANQLGYLGLVVPALMVLAATLLSFLPNSHPKRAAYPALSTEH